MSNPNLSVKEALKKEVKEKFGKPLNSLNSFQELSQLTNLSSQTLRRFFGKIDKDKKVGYASISLICQFLGHKDWDHYLEYFEYISTISLKDQIFIESMASFFRSGNSYNDDYLQNTTITDTMNDYAEIIYKTKENTLYFYKCYQNNNWATNYIFAWLPNYNFFGQDWFREILQNRIQHAIIAPTKLALCNFLIFGDFLTGANVNIQQDLPEIHQYYEEYSLRFPYSPYHEMRYHTILLMDAKNNKDRSFQKIVDRYLEKLNNAGLSEFRLQELIIAFSNTLLWMQEYELAYQMLKPIKNFISNYEKSQKVEPSVHFLGINMAFVKTTFALTWITNDKKFSSEIKYSEFQDVAGLLYSDYIRTMYLANCIIKEKTVLKKKLIFNDLKEVVSKTGYAKIYDILEDKDSLFLHYSA